jgi:amidohydrolase
MPGFIEQAKSMQQQIVEWRRELHKIPEVGLDLPETSAFVSKVLTELGIEYRTKVGISGIVGLIKGGKPGKTIMLRADMDALALKEETGLPFTSTNENMHACGHDSHTAMLLGAAKILNENRQQLTGNVKLVFQPAEEGPGGAKPMIDDGAMDNPSVDAALGLHIGCLFKEIGNGQVGVHYGNIMACLDKFYIKLKGRGCHGATPEVGVDPIPIAGQVIGALQTIVSRETKPTRPAVVTIGQIHGGRTYNIIPDTVELEGTARAVDQEIRENIARRIEEVVAGIAKGMGGDYEYKYTFGYPPVVNNAEFTKAFVESAKKVVGADNIIEITEPTMGGEDMAYYLERVPGTFFFLGSINEAKGIIHPHHNPKFDVDEDVFWIGTALMVQGAVDWLENNV